MTRILESQLLGGGPVTAGVVPHNQQFNLVAKMKAIADRIGEMPSYNWSLSMLCNLKGLQLILEWNGNKREYQFPGFNWISLCYPNPAAWAHADLSQMWQHVPDDRDTKVFRSQPYASNISLVRGFSLNVEGREQGWALDRVIACDDVVDIIAENEPEIELHESAPPIMIWWNAGWTAIGKRG